MSRRSKKITVNAKTVCSSTYQSRVLGFDVEIRGRSACTLPSLFKEKQQKMTIHFNIVLCTKIPYPFLISYLPMFCKTDIIEETKESREGLISGQGVEELISLHRYTAVLGVIIHFGKLFNPILGQAY